MIKSWWKIRLLTVIIVLCLLLPLVLLVLYHSDKEISQLWPENLKISDGNRVHIKAYELTSNDYINLDTLILEGPIPKGSEFPNIKLLTKFKNLKNLTLYNIKIISIKPLAKLKELQTLEINNLDKPEYRPSDFLIKIRSFLRLPAKKPIENNTIFDKMPFDISPIGRLTKLEKLSIKNLKIKNIKSIGNIKNLQHLEFHNLYLSDNSISPLSNLTDLKYLSIYGSSYDLRANNIQPLKTLVNLETLNLSELSIKDLSPLTGLKNLQILGFYRARVNNISPLANLTNLRSLSLEYTQVTDIQPIANLTNLKTLYISGTKVSDEQVAELQKALPNVRIIR
jgi:internalin A